MSNEVYLRKVLGSILFAILIVLAFLVLRPVIISIIIALILAFVFLPVYKFLYKHTKAKNLSAILIVVFLILLIILPVWFLTPILVKQSFTIFQATQQIDFVGPLKSLFPSLFASEEFAAEIGSILSSFTTRAANFLVNFFADFILNFPTLALQFTVVLFTFFFVLRDSEKVVAYVKSVLPVSKEVEKKLFEYSKGITSSVIYGQVIVGIVQGIVAGLGFFIFGVPNALFLTILASLAGIFPIIGTALVWIPVAIYLFISGSTGPAWGVAIFGIMSSTVDNFLRPMIVSRRTKIHSAIVLISMIGGVFFFGILGFILGPLIISYLLIFLELYRGKQKSQIIIEEPVK
ncbi:MAG TPA: AI-2E family transporter [Candidatus Pacearchaeota archaeon]|nr:AI-2E family transporter [Candidatus Pacearchaeota archaeon]